IYRLEPWDEPEPLVRMDPLTRGSLFHTAQAEFYRTMQARGALPIDKAHVADAVKTLDAVLDRVAENYAETLAPAIERVWRDEIGELRRDLGIWVQKLADDQTWRPEYFEFSFGLDGEGRDPRSVKEPIVIDEGFILRGSVDLIEEHAQTGFLAAAPDERACTWCDFRPVCGPRVEQRTAGKARDRIADLEALRGMR